LSNSPLLEEMKETYEMIRFFDRRSWFAVSIYTGIFISTLVSRFFLNFNLYYKIGILLVQLSTLVFLILVLYTGRRWNAVNWAKVWLCRKKLGIIRRLPIEPPVPGCESNILDLMRRGKITDNVFLELFIDHTRYKFSSETNLILFYYMLLLDANLWIIWGWFEGIIGAFCIAIIIIAMFLDWRELRRWITYKTNKYN